MKEFREFLMERTDVGLGNSYLYAFLVFTPLLILVSWLLETGVDTPAKKFANKVDIALRLERPRLREGEADEGDVPCWKFALRSWEIWALFIWFTTILLITEIYGAFNGNKERIEAGDIRT